MMERRGDEKRKWEGKYDKECQRVRERRVSKEGMEMEGVSVRREMPRETGATAKQREPLRDRRK